MAKKASTCTYDAITATVTVLPEAAKLIAIPHLQETLGEYLSVTGKELTQRTESVGIMASTVGKRIQQLDQAPEKFSSLDRTAATQKNTKMYTRNVGLEDLVSHHTLAPAYARIAGLVRAMRKGNITSDSVKDFSARIAAGESVVRSSGIPIVIHKAVVQTGKMHYSFLGMGDITRIFIKTGYTDVFGEAILRSSVGTENIQFQNLAEAVRRVIEESTGPNPEKIVDSIKDALTNSIGKPVNATEAAALKKAMEWTSSTEGSKIVDKLTTAMSDPKFIKELLKEDNKLAAVTVALARADGYKLAAETLQSVADLTHQGERLKGYGDLLLNNGIVDLFGKDALVKLTPDNLNLAFAQNAIALAFSHLDDTSLAVITATTRKARGIAKDAAAKVAGKKTKTGLNKANSEVAKDTAEAVTKQVEDEMQNDVTIRNMESSIEASSIARQYYLENYYGTVVGGLAKAISKVSNIATMGSKMKTQLIGVEHLRLENSAIVTSELRKFADLHGQDIPKFNSIFKALQATTDETRASIIAGMPKADQEIANGLTEFIDGIYGMGEWNKLVQEGIHASEMTKSLKMVGQTKQAAMFEARSITNADEAKDFWKELELGEEDNIIEILSKYHAAIQLSMIKPTLAESVVRHFSHTAEGLTRPEAIKQGYRPIAAENGLSEFLVYGENPPLFHPEVVAKLQSLNHYLEFTRGFKNETMQKLVNRLDPMVSVLKASNTIWRPGHHVTSALGNLVSNMLAGVFDTRHYIMAARVMKQHGMIDHLDEGVLAEITKTNIPEGYVFKGNENGVKIALKDSTTGKIKQYSLDYEGIGKGATAVAGVRITPRRAKDVVENELQQGTVTSALMKNPASKGIAAADHQLARASAARDNIFRYALFIKELEKGGPYKNLEEAFQAAGAKVHEFHPTVGTLTAEERKIARRLFYFYTWQKQAFFKVLDLMANAPAYVTVPSKMQYAIAESQGLNPESFGQPFDPTQLFAAYNTNTVYGPQFNTEYGPAGIKPAITQLDVIDSYLSQFQTKPGAGLWENIGNMATTGAVGIFAKNISPAFKIPAELATGNKIGDVGKITDVPQYLLDQTGISSPTRITGQTPWGQRSDYKTGPYENANRERQLWNWLLGSKYTFYQSPTALDTARKERLDYFKRTNHNGN
jgi:hypothetical protein